MKRILSGLLAVALVLTVWPAAAQNGAKVKLGVLVDGSGPYADASGQGSTVMAELALEDFGGKVLGQPVEILSADHQNKMDVGTAIVRQWLDVEHVSAIFDVPHSGILLATQEIVREKGGLLIASAGGTSAFSGAACSPYGFQWTYDTFALASGAGRELARQGLKTWFLLQVDGAFGEAAASDLNKVVSSSGGRVLGAVKTPINSSDFSAYLLQAQASGANVVGLLNAGKDTANSLKQANEFGLTAAGQRIFGMVLFEADALAVGLDKAQGLVTTSPFYWAQSPEAEAVSRRFIAKVGRAPSWIQIGVYSSVLQYLKAVQTAGTSDREAVAAKLRTMPVNDAYVTGGRVRADGRMLHEMLLTQVRSPAEMQASAKGRDDVYKIIGRIPAEEAARPLDGSCPGSK